MHTQLSLAAVVASILGPAGIFAACSTKPVNFFLAGDSTTAVQSSGGGGWGNGFIGFLQSPAKGENLGHNGATTVSFVSGGDWKTVLNKVKSSAAAGNEPFVTIQFGHNDQKADKGISLDQYQANLEKLAAEVRSNGGTPILVTPLTRRGFSGSAVVENLNNERDRTIAAGAKSGTRVLDLNRASTAYVNKIGQTAAWTYNLKEGDNTHLNDHGSVVFGRMLADLLLGHAPTLSTSSRVKRDLVCRADEKAAPECFKSALRSDDALSKKIWSGQVA